MPVTQTTPKPLNRYTLDINQVTHALADSLDLVGVDDVGHGKRVAFMADACGRVMGLDAGQRDFLFDAAILHDCGVSSTSLHQKLVTQLDYSNAAVHCIRGALLLEGVEPYAPLAPVVRLHHTHWSQLVADGVPEETAVMANVIFMTDRADAFAAQVGGSGTREQRRTVRDLIARLSGEHFAPHLVEAFLAASAHDGFWLMQERDALCTNVSLRLNDSRPVSMTFGQLRQLAAIFSNVVDTKSPFTQEHSLGVSRLARRLAEWSGLPASACDQVEIAGLLHDLGKLRVPDEILDKPGPLDDDEVEVIHRHSYDSYQILRRVEGWERIARWAGMHHEALSGEGYPFHYHGEEIGLEARIIIVADVFQALTQNRPYRASLPPERVLAIMRDMVGERRIDGELVELVAGRMEECLVAAVVHTND